MEGRQLPGQPGYSPAAIRRLEGLQWRAGQLPGQPGVDARDWGAGMDPSMEGRDNCPAKLAGVTDEREARRVPSMEGRTIARPTRPRRRCRRCASASMEGRTIARPTRSAGCLPSGRHQLPSMEGRTIARPNAGRSDLGVHGVELLQWRAGQLPGQTREARIVLDADRFLQWRATIARPNAVAQRSRKRALCAHLQWRPTIARPNQPGGPARQRIPVLPSMEGRTIARPNRPILTVGSWAVCSLQWRAGQLPGQTPTPAPGARPQQTHLNGGPDNCPAKPASRHQHRPGSDVPQWRAGQLPGQLGSVKLSASCLITFNGGPDNCPAKRRHQSLPLRSAKPSMEGPDNCPAKRPPPATLDSSSPALQ